MANKFEASMGFDIEMVSSFLDQLKDALELGLDVEAMTEFVENTKVEDERQQTFDVDFKGDEASMTFVVFMDDTDAADLAFFVSSPDLADEISKQMEIFCEKNDI